MGLTVHYSGGRAKSQAKIDECLAFVQDVAKKLPCKFDIIDETFKGVLDDWRRPKNTQNGQVITVRQKGILLWLDEGCEPLNISFDYNSSAFCHYFMPHKDSRLSKTGFFCKTQFSQNFLRTHHIVCKILETIKQKYVRGLRVSDEGEYFGRWDKKHLEKVYNEWSGLINSFGKALGKLKIGANTDIEKSIRQAAKEAYKDEKLKKLFGT